MAEQRASTKKIVKEEESFISVPISDLTDIKKTLASINTKLQTVDSMLIKLNQTVVGDKDYGQIGLIEMTKEHAEYITKDKDFKSKLVGGTIALGVIWGVIIRLWTREF